MLIGGARGPQQMNSWLVDYLSDKSHFGEASQVMLTGNRCNSRASGLPKKYLWLHHSKGAYEEILTVNLTKPATEDEVIASL